MDSKNIKVAFFDVDGTLVDMGLKVMTPKTKEALLGLQANGIKICIATGRSAIRIPKFEGLEFDVLMAFNGSYCFDRDGHDIFKQVIPTEDVERMVRNADAMGRPLALATATRTQCNGVDEEMIEYFSFSNDYPDIAKDFNGLVHDEVIQIMAGSDPKEHAALMEGVKGAKLTYWWVNGVDIIPAGSGKQVGVAHVLDYLGLQPENAIAFGDAANDIGMLQYCSTGVVMGNGTPEAKAVADVICGRADEDGIYYFCKENGLIER